MRHGREILGAAYYADFVLKVTEREVMIFFLEISSISGCITPSLKIVALRSGDLQIMPLAINENNLHGWCASRQKSLGTTDIQSCLLNSFAPA